MLKDVEESRRITRAIQGHFGDETAQTLDVTVASHLYWPPLANEPLELPPAIAREAARFEKQYAHRKAPRKLVWRPSLGCVTLDASAKPAASGLSEGADRGVARRAGRRSARRG